MDKSELLHYVEILLQELEENRYLIQLLISRFPNHPVGQIFSSLDTYYPLYKKLKELKAKLCNPGQSIFSLLKQTVSSSYNWTLGCITSVSVGFVASIVGKATIIKDNVGKISPLSSWLGRLIQLPMQTGMNLLESLRTLVTGIFCGLSKIVIIS